MRRVWLASGLVLTALAIVGAMLPVMPSTVFALGAAACFSRSSPRFEAWLLNHPRMGPSVRAWRQQRAVPTRAKVVAVSMMAVSVGIVGLTAPPAVVVGVAAVLACVAIYLITRPTPTLAGGGMKAP
ncbi:MAG: YbaN family protein [Alphaproteobacteria bacterium]|nr:YbaN family protein [Alphaproteobacteria bacterium]